MSRTSKVFALSFGKGLNTVMALVSGMVMARILTQAELATYRQTMLAYQIAIPLLALGIPHAIYYFLPTEKTRARGLVVDALIIMVTMGLLYTVFIVLGGNHLLAKRFSNPAIVNTLVYLVPLPLVMLPAGLLPSVMVVQNRVSTLTVYNVLSRLLLALGIIATCLLWRNPESMVLARVGISIVTGLIAVALILLAVPKDEFRPSMGNIKAMLKFSTPLVIAGGLGTISVQLDKVIVSALCSPKDFAVYVTGALEIPLIGIITGSIASVILPDLRRMVAAGDYDDALRLFRQAATKSATFLIPTMMFLLVSAEPFILTLFSSKYAGSVLPFRLYLLIIPMRIVTFSSFMVALGLNRIILYRSAVGLAVNGVLSVLLVNRIGFNGAIMATILSLYCVEGVWCVTAIRHSTGCRWPAVFPFRRLLQLILVSSLSCVPIVVLTRGLSHLYPPALLSLNAISFSVSMLSVIWLFRVEFLKSELLNYLNMLMSKIKTAWS